MSTRVCFDFRNSFNTSYLVLIKAYFLTPVWTLSRNKPKFVYNHFCIYDLRFPENSP